VGTGKSAERVEIVARPPNVDAAFLLHCGTTIRVVDASLLHIHVVLLFQEKRWD
jgi:hypothetical protein